MLNLIGVQRLSRLDAVYHDLEVQARQISPFWVSGVLCCVPVDFRLVRRLSVTVGKHATW